MRTLFPAVVACLLVLPVQAKYSGGTGTTGDPYQIATAADLIALGESPGDYYMHFILTADLDLDPNLPGRKTFDKAVIAPVITSPGELLQSGTAFAGVFDGAGHTISRLTIAGEDYLGLFGRLAAAGEVRNLAVADVNVTGSGDYIGGLVGLNSGRIKASYVNGEIRGGFGVGGLAGGGYGVITACYAQARVSGTRRVGGFVGSAGGTVVRCYATGRVVRAAGGEFLGGFAGEGNDNGFVKGCLWDTQASGIGVSGCGIGFDTAGLMQPEAYSRNGWAGDPNWVLAAGQDYPRLAWEGSPGQIIGEPLIDFLTGSGTTEDPYQIATADQLALLGTASVLWDKALVLTADLDVNGVPIRRVGICPGSEFRGIFDGRGHTIRNLTMDSGDQSAWRMGLFGWIHTDGQVSHLNLEHAVIRGGARSTGLGALAGFNTGWLSNCTATNVVVEKQSAREGGATSLGGLVGLNGGRVDHCQVSGNVSGDSVIGGLVGYNYGDIVHCRTDVAISGRRSLLGGLVGVNAGFSALQPGGPAADYWGTLENSCATGPVAGGEDSDDVGGLAGDNAGDIAACYATSTVSGRQTVGGLVGYNSWAATITNSYARGEIVARAVAGGLVADNAGTVATCYATGKTTGDEDVGGLEGYNPFGDMAACFWDIQTSGLSESAGGTGRTTAEMQTARTFLDAGWDFAGETANGTEDVWWIDEGKDYPRLAWERGD
jgi:hypothetical protein